MDLDTVAVAVFQFVLVRTRGAVGGHFIVERLAQELFFELTVSCPVDEKLRTVLTRKAGILIVFFFFAILSSVSNTFVFGCFVMCVILIFFRNIPNAFVTLVLIWVIDFAIVHSVGLAHFVFFKIPVFANLAGILLFFLQGTIGQ
jgi:hypothetical protein